MFCKEVFVGKKKKKKQEIDQCRPVGPFVDTHGILDAAPKNRFAHEYCLLHSNEIQRKDDQWFNVTFSNASANDFR